MKKCPDCGGNLYYLGDEKHPADAFECQNCGEVFDRGTEKRLIFDIHIREYVPVAKSI